MSLIDIILLEQVSSEKKKSLCRDLRQLRNVINADYQSIDSEDIEFTNCVLSRALEILEVQEKYEIYGTN